MQEKCSINKQPPSRNRGFWCGHTPKPPLNWELTKKKKKPCKNHHPSTFKENTLFSNLGTRVKSVAHPVFQTKKERGRFLKRIQLFLSPTFPRHLWTICSPQSPWTQLLCGRRNSFELRPRIDLKKQVPLFPRASKLEALLRTFQSALS